MSMHVGSTQPRLWRAPVVVLGLAVGAACWGYPHEASALRGVAVTTAWAGAGLLVASLLLMLREPRLARWLGGLEAMYAWHHRSGVLGYVLLLGHPLAMALGAWQDGPRAAWHVLVPWSQGWQAWPIGLGWAGLLLLMLGLTATFARSLVYRRWHAFHALLGLGVLLGWAHVLPLADVAVLPSLGLAVVSMVLGWRILVVDAGASAFTYRVSKVSSVAAGVIEATLQPLGASMALAPGQFVLARFLDDERYRACGEFHPFTVSSMAAEDGSLRITVKALGACSWRIQSIAEGVLVRLQGPFGNFLSSVPEGPELWVAGGIGITPFMAAMRQHPCVQPTTLIYVYRTPADAIFLEELEQLQASDPLLQLLARASDGSPQDLERLLQQVAQVDGRQVHICGPSGLVQALRPMLHGRGVAASAIHHESFDFR